MCLHIEGHENHVRESQHKNYRGKVGCQGAYRDAERMREDQGEGTCVRAGDERSENHGNRARDEKAGKSESAEGPDAEYFQVPKEIAADELDDVRGARNYDWKIRRGETLFDSFNLENAVFGGGIPFHEHINKGSLLVVRKKKSLPERAFQGIVRVLRTFRKRLNRVCFGNLRKRCGQLTDFAEVSLGTDVSPCAQDDLRLLQEDLGDQLVLLKLRIIAREKEVFIHPRLQINVAENGEDEKNGQTAPDGE